MIPRLRLILPLLASLLALESCTDRRDRGPVSADDRLLDDAVQRPEPNPRQLTGLLRDPPLATSQELAGRYALLESRLIDEGKLREDLGDISALTPDTLATNFLRIALYDEYAPVDGRFVAQESSSFLRRWETPVTLGLHFGASVEPPERAADTAVVEELAAELSEVSGHPVSVSAPEEAVFNVFVVNERERLGLAPDLQAMIPGISPKLTETILDILPSTFCLVVAFSDRDHPQTYMHALAIIRAEHPPVLRRACFHEEISQGLGLANDSPDARPSIFNDDEEFALLTAHDRLLLAMLYDARLSPGMTVAEAEPLALELATELLLPEADDIPDDGVTDPATTAPEVGPEDSPEGSPVAADAPTAPEQTEAPQSTPL